MISSKKPVFFFTFFVAVTLFFAGCVTTKNTFIHRQWHNMNARYNGYFYAKESINEVLKKVKKENVDDYTKLLPLFVYPDEAELKTYGDSFDKTILKSSTVIQRHAITNPKTKEEIANACRWIDENYVLIGRSHFYKKEYITAEEMFTYVSQKYEDPKAKYPGLIWLIRTNNELGSLSLSESIIDEIRNAEDFPKDKKLKREFTNVSADYFIKQEDYPEAIRRLEESLLIIRNKEQKARNTFILAQLYELTGNKKKAAEHFADVPGLHPNYEMLFVAKMNWVRLVDIENGDNTEKVKRDLKKMLKDSKNKEYLDQIYYALAGVAIKEKDETLALEYLDNSVKNSIDNNNQKALSFMKTGDILFNRQDYKGAEANFDSTITYLSDDYPDYNKIISRQNSLKELVTNIRIIEHGDTLLRLARMPQKEREKEIKQIHKQIEEERLKKEADQAALAIQQAALRKTTSSSPVVSNKSWYFYNPSAVSFGAGEFTKKWGDRILEDHWRRSDKPNDAFASPIDNLDSNNDAVVNSPTATTNATASADVPSNYLSFIPSTSKEIDLVNKKIIDAYYRLGTIYKEELNNSEKAMDVFLTLITRYRENDYKLQVYYQLYRLYISNGDQSRAENFKKMILDTYPTSEYAMIINDPDYLKKKKASKSLIEDMYGEALDHYTNKQYEKTVEMCNTAISKYGGNHLIGKFGLLKAYAVAKLDNNSPALREALELVVKKAPNTPEQEKAQQILDKIVKSAAPAIDTSAVVVAVDSVLKDTGYVYSEKGSFYWVVISEKSQVELPKLKAKIDTLNTKLFSKFKLNTVTPSLKDTSMQMMLVKTFDNKKDAMSYYNFFDESKKALQSSDIKEFSSFIISKENYRLFFDKQDIEEYKRFFSSNFN